jgi:hypothetical protein
LISNDIVIFHKDFCVFLGGFFTGFAVIDIFGAFDVYLAYLYYGFAAYATSGTFWLIGASS